MKCPYCKYTTIGNEKMINHIAAEHAKQYHKHHRGRKGYGLPLSDGTRPEPAGLRKEVRVKPAEPTDDPGQVMAAMMPLVENLATGRRLEVWESGEDGPCPVCEAACIVRPELLLQAAQIYAGRMVPVCTRCALKARAGELNLDVWLLQHNKTPGRVLAEVLNHVGVKGTECGCCDRFVPMEHTQITRFEKTMSMQEVRERLRKDPDASLTTTTYCMQCETRAAQLPACPKCGLHRANCCRGGRGK